VQASLRQAMALAQKRMKQHETIESNFKLLTVKMDTMEKAFRYLKSRIVAINKGEQLTEEIDNLVLGVESVEELSADTSTLLEEARGKAAAKRQGVKG
jgi:hypothetical protein